MITPKLEELIWCGKAFFKTYVAAGSKSVLNIGDDRFIIITDITYSSGYNVRNANELFAPDMQLSIYGERGFNHYMFRDRGIGVMEVSDSSGGTIQTAYTTPFSMPKIDTYLIHTKQVGFSFIKNVSFGTAVIGVASFDNPAYEPPLDYGKDGMTGAIGVATSLTPSIGFENVLVNRANGMPVGSNATQQYQFDARAANRPEADQNPYLPFANINYIEILGQPNNIGL